MFAWVEHSSLLFELVNWVPKCFTTWKLRFVYDDDKLIEITELDHKLVAPVIHLNHFCFSNCSDKALGDDYDLLLH